MNFLVDSSIYLRILTDGRFARRTEPALRRVAPRLYLSSVVRAELTQGARGAAGRSLVDRIASDLERVGRVVAPTHTDWVRAATVQSMLWDSMPALRSKRLLADILIACGARRIGACILTANEKDFAAIDRWLPTERLGPDDLTND